MYVRVLFIQYIDVGMMGGCLNMFKPTVRIKVFWLNINWIIILLKYRLNKT
jgi:hypothetical protein